MIARIDEARSNGDTVGGVFEVVVHGLPIGLGSYVQWDRRLDAALAAAVMSINIVKGVEFGLGFEQTRRFGSEVHDVIEGRGEGGRWIHRSNNAGGLTGGVTNGEPLVVRGAVKPISTLARPLPSADLLTGEAVDKAHYERSDISVVPAAGVVGEAMVMLTLADFVLEKFGGDSLAETRDNLERYRERISRAAGRRRRRRRRAPDGAVEAASPAPAATTRPAMDVVLVGLPGSGKSAVGRRLAHRHGAAFVDLDEAIEQAAGRRIPEIFEERGRGRLPGARARGRRGARAGGPRAGRPPGDRDRRRRRRRPAQPLAALPRPPAGLARRPARRSSPSGCAAARTCGRSSPGRDPIGAIRDAGPRPGPVLRRRRPAERRRRDGERSSSAVDELAAARAGADRPATRAAPRADTISGRVVLGEGIAAGGGRGSAPRARTRARAILVSEPGAWAAAGESLADALAAAAGRSSGSCCPQGEDAKRLVGDRGRRAASWPRLRAERREPLVAIGGGALGDAAGFLAAT